MQLRRLLLSNRYVSAFAKHLSKKKNPVSNNKTSFYFNGVIFRARNPLAIGFNVSDNLTFVKTPTVSMLNPLTSCSLGISE